MTTTMTLTNEYHGTQTTIRPREDGTISAATYHRATRALCPSPSCRCSSSSASGPGVLPLCNAEPVYGGARIVAYKIPGIRAIGLDGIRAIEIEIGTADFFHGVQGSMDGVDAQSTIAAYCGEIADQLRELNPGLAVSVESDSRAFGTRIRVIDADGDTTCGRPDVDDCWPIGDVASDLVRATDVILMQQSYWRESPIV